MTDQEVMTIQKDYWADDGATFVHYGKGYRTGKGGGVVCIGKYPPDKATEAPAQPTEVNNTGVTGQKPIETTTAPQTGIMLQVKTPHPVPMLAQGGTKHPGRPAKAPDEPVSRMTLWRRAQKEQQATLILT